MTRCQNKNIINCFVSSPPCTDTQRHLGLFIETAPLYKRRYLGKCFSAVWCPIIVWFPPSCSPIIRTVRFCFSFFILASISQRDNVSWRYPIFVTLSFALPLGGNARPEGVGVCLPLYRKYLIFRTPKKHILKDSEAPNIVFLVVKF